MATARVAQIIEQLMLVTDPDPNLPTRLCIECASAMTMTGAGLSLMSPAGSAGHVGAANEISSHLEELQFSLGEGPCLDSLALGRPVLHPDLEVSGLDRWPAYSRASLDAGINAVFAFPLQIGSIRLGALDIYRDRPGALDEVLLVEALAFADAALMVLLHLQDHMPLDQGLHTEFWVGPATRREVHQATGMVSVQASIGLDEALMLLRARAFSEERPVLDVARDVVERRVRFENDQEGPE
jgi:hypothetical protein